MSNSLPHFCIVCTVLPSLKQHHHDVSQTPSEPLLRRFCSLPPPSPRDESDVELVSKLLLQHHNPFHATESSLQLHSITLTPTLLRLKNHSKIALSLFHCAKTLPEPLSPTHPTPSSSTPWPRFANSTCMVTYRRNGPKPPHPNPFYFPNPNSPPHLRPPHAPSHICVLLDTLCKYGHVRLAVEVFNKNKHIFPTIVKIYTALIYGWCKLGSVKMAQTFLKDMIDKGIEPNVVTYNVLLNGVCRKVSLHPEEVFERTIRNAEEVFDQMRESGIEPEVTSFSILFHVNSRAHMPQLVLDQLRLMKEKGICPNVVMYTSVIKCLASCGWLEDAERLLEEMVRDGVSPCAATYNCFFKKFRGRKDGESALRMFKRMKEDGLCAPSLHTYVILIRMFLRFEMIKVVKEIWEDMKETGAGLDLDLYTVLIHGLCEGLKWREACHYFVEMIENGFLLLKGTFDTLLQGTDSG
ncbi:hypothetical protein JHK86_038974 [Glycine max]|nr:hypothetical protein JHK86_038974 [Glycine max]